MSDVTGPDEVSSGESNQQRQTNNWTLIGPVAAAFALVVSAAVVAAYRFGEGVVYIGERTISDMNFLEVTGGAALGVLGAIAGVGAAAVGAIAALVATIIGVAVGALGLAFGALVAIGVVTGPLLLVGIIGVMIKRRYWPDVI